MDDPAKTDWIAAVALRLGEAYRVGIRFLHPCPDDFLVAALLEIDLGPTLLGGPRPQSVDDFRWRRTSRRGRPQATEDSSSSTDQDWSRTPISSRTDSSHRRIPLDPAPGSSRSRSKTRP